MLVGLRHSATFIPVIVFYPSSSLLLEGKKKNEDETNPLSSHLETDSLVREYTSVTKVFALIPYCKKKHKFQE